MNLRYATLALILIALILPVSASTGIIGVTWNQSNSSPSAFSAYWGANYAPIATPDFNATEPWASMGRVNNSATQYQTMVQVKKHYYRTENITIGGNHYMNFSISDTPQTGYTVDPWHVVNGTEVPWVYIGAYEASAYNVTTGTYVGDPASVNSQPGRDRLASVAGQKPLSGLGKSYLTLPAYRNMSQSRGTGWELQPFNGISVIQRMYIIEMRNWDSQSVIGTGVTQITDDGATNMAIPTGLTAGIGTNSTDCGNFTCSVSTVHYQTSQNTNQVSYRGWEGGIGGVWEGLDGINIQANRNPWVANYGFASDVFASPYINTTLVFASSNGYISNLIYSSGFDYSFLPSGVAGSSTTYITDGFFQTTGTRIVYNGGGWSSTTNAGIFSRYAADTSTNPSRFYGSRLAFTPPLYANFTHTNASATFTFTDTSFGVSTRTGLSNPPTSWNWSFGNGNLSTLQNPNHTYIVPGTYLVNLTVSDGVNYATSLQEISAPIILVTAQFIPNGSVQGTSPLTISFNDTSIGLPTSWDWLATPLVGAPSHFSALQNPTNIFLTGNYSVTLTASNGFDTNTSAATWINVSAAPVIPTPVPTLAGGSMVQGINGQVPISMLPLIVLAGVGFLILSIFLAPQGDISGIIKLITIALCGLIIIYVIAVVVGAIASPFGG